jgi:hypothetical protein
MALHAASRLENVLSRRESLSVGNKHNSLVARSGDHGGCGIRFILFSFTLAARLDTVVNGTCCVRSRCKTSSSFHCSTARYQLGVSTVTSATQMTATYSPRSSRLISGLNSVVRGYSCGKVKHCPCAWSTWRNENVWGSSTALSGHNHAPAALPPRNELPVAIG